MNFDEQDPLNLRDVDRLIRINRLRWRMQDDPDAARIDAGERLSGPTTEEAHFSAGLASEEIKPWTTHWQILRSHGFHFMPPAELDGASLSRELWRLIRALASLRVYLCNTNHLSDAELYRHLWCRGLREDVVDWTDDEDGAWHLDMVGSGSEEDTYLSFKYYADDEWRAQWLEDYPDYKMPRHVDPPYDRDRWLPQRSLPGESR